jgi:hypothetical protein
LESNSVFDVLYIGKIVLTIIFVALSLVGIYILFQFRRWHTDLLQMEQTAHFLRDDAMFNMMSYRANLASVKQKIAAAENRITTSGPVLSNKVVVDSALAALTMLMQKERSILQWGTLGVKLAKSAFDYFTKGR